MCDEVGRGWEDITRKCRGGEVVQVKRKIVFNGLKVEGYESHVVVKSYDDVI